MWRSEWPVEAKNSTRHAWHSIRPAQHPQTLWSICYKASLSLLSSNLHFWCICESPQFGFLPIAFLVPPTNQLMETTLLCSSTPWSSICMKFVTISSAYPSKCLEREGGRPWQRLKIYDQQCPPTTIEQWEMSIFPGDSCPLARQTSHKAQGSQLMIAGKSCNHLNC